MITKKIYSSIDKGLFPNRLLRLGARFMCFTRQRELLKKYKKNEEQKDLFFQNLLSYEIAEDVSVANDQHYELPTDFFKLVLGKQLKYSSAYWEKNCKDLTEAEINSLEKSIQHAQVENGQRILELGCGWGSLSLYLAQKFPNCTITAVSNSKTQESYIKNEIEKRKLTNVTYIRSDITTLELNETYDRILSIEMFEHLTNYSKVFQKLSQWSDEQTKLFIHIFTHKDYPYQLSDNQDESWLGHHFFANGMMPSVDLFEKVQKTFKVEKQWIWPGTHYEKTANHWLKNLELNKDKVIPLFEKHYGKEESITWYNRWKVFFISCAELFGYNKGQLWGVTHYLLSKNEK